MANRLTLSPRLRAVAGLVPDHCACLADIGTDHGYVPVFLLLEGRIQRAIAADIAKPPLDHARRTAEQYGIAGRIDFRLGNGLSVLTPEEAEWIVIAGMGGDTIADILSAAPWCHEKSVLLLQPMSKADELRRWLPQNGFSVQAERLVQDKGVLYPILAVHGGEMPPASEAQAWGGFLLEQDPLWGLYLSDRILRLRRAAAGLAQSSATAAAHKRALLLQVVEELEAKKGEWEIAHGT